MAAIDAKYAHTKDETLGRVLLEGFIGHLAGLIVSVLVLAIIFGFVQSCVAGIAGG